MLAIYAATVLAIFACDVVNRPTLVPERRPSLTFADARSRRRFDEYRARLERDPTRFADELATVRRLERSDVDYRFAVVGRFDGLVEGEITTDGERVLLLVSDVGGPQGDLASIDSRIAHELEHARQFDAGELALAQDPSTGRWASHYASYDVGDEVKAWRAQLALAESGDYWLRRDNSWRPTLLRLFSDEKTDEGRARVLARHGYGRVNPVVGANVRFDVSSGYSVGQLVRPDGRPGCNVFGRVAALDDACLFLGSRPGGRRERG